MYILKTPRGDMAFFILSAAELFQKIYGGDIEKVEHEDTIGKFETS